MNKNYGVIVQADNLEFLDFVRGDKTRCVFADIPDNIGLKYDGVDDNLPPERYERRIETLIRGSLTIADVFWLSYNTIHERMIYRITERYANAWKIRKIIWYFTFGQYEKTDFTSCYRPIMCFHADWTPPLNFDAIRVDSVRMQIGDKRAAGLKVPGDVWEFPRVVGNAKERRAWHVTQHPEALMERIALLSCSQTINGRTEMIGHFTDLCLGSGTSGVVCNRFGINWTGVELSKSYCEQLGEQFGCAYINLEAYRGN